MAASYFGYFLDVYQSFCPKNHGQLAQVHFGDRDFLKSRKNSLKVRRKRKNVAEVDAGYFSALGTQIRCRT